MVDVGLSEKTISDMVDNILLEHDKLEYYLTKMGVDKDKIHVDIDKDKLKRKYLNMVLRSGIEKCR